MPDKTPYSIMKPIIEKAENNFIMNDGDYFDDDDLLVCGKCGKPKQMRMSIEGYRAGNEIIVPVMCKCDEERLAKEKADRERQDYEDRQKRLKAESLMDRKFYDATFEKYQVDKFNERPYNICLKYTQSFDKMLEKNQGLLLWGNIGTGKSYIAACIANELMKKGIPVLMTSLIRILEMIQSNYGDESSILNRINSAKLVIFDDLGAERNTGFGIEKMYSIIDSRYRRGLPMIVTTNISLTEMKEDPDVKYGRIYDRIFETCFPVQFTGNSRRRTEANNRFLDMKRFINEE